MTYSATAFASFDEEKLGQRKGEKQPKSRVLENERCKKSSNQYKTIGSEKEGIKNYLKEWVNSTNTNKQRAQVNKNKTSCDES